MESANEENGRERGEQARNGWKRKQPDQYHTWKSNAMPSKAKQSKAKDYFLYSICLCRSYGNAFLIIEKYFHGWVNALRSTIYYIAGCRIEYIHYKY